MGRYKKAAVLARQRQQRKGENAMTTTQVKNITAALIFQARNLGNLLIAAFAAIKVQAESIKASRMARIVCWFILAALGLTLWTLVTFRVAQRDAQRSFEQWQARFADEFISQQEAAERGMPPDPKEMLREQEIATIAQVLYGVKGNSDSDLHTYCWVLFNRVDIKSGEFSTVDSIAAAVEKPGQFMGYSENNPILGSLKKIATEEYEIWREGKDRPCDVEYVFAYWTPDKIVLLKDLKDLIHTWRYGA